MVSRSLGHTADGKNNCRQPAKLVDVDHLLSIDGGSGSPSDFAVYCLKRASRVKAQHSK
jgi:hypothetical protein